MARIEALLRVLPGPKPLLFRYAMTALFVGVALGIRQLVGEPGRYGFLNFILPVVAAALIFDRGAGFFAIALSAVLVGAVMAAEGGQVPIGATLVFILVCTCLVFIADGLHQALIEANAARNAADVLLQEMSHRVKNKFTMISSIISLQARGSSAEVQSALSEIATRVNIISTVHDYLQRSRHNGVIDLSEYLPGLCRALHAALAGQRPISLFVDAVKVEVPAERALAIGMIVNELVTNAFKYAFESDHKPGHLEVRLAHADSTLCLEVIDDGKGYSRNSDSPGGLGTRLISVFAAQLGGDANWEARYAGGCRASVRFPER